MVLLNVNGLTLLLAGARQAFSPAILLCCLVLILAGVRHVPPSRALGAPGLVLLGALVSYLWSGLLVALVTGLEHRVDFWPYLRGHVVSPVMVLAAALGSSVVLRETGDERLLTGILVLLTVTCIVVLMSPMLPTVSQFVPATSRYRMHGSFLDPNEAGFAGCMTAALATVLLRSRRRRPLAWLALTVAAAAVVASASRTAFISLVLIFAVLLVLNRGGRRYFLGWFAVVGLVVGGAAALGFEQIAGELDPKNIARIQTVMDAVRQAEITDRLFGGRLYWWREGWDALAGSPVFGAGLGAFREIHGMPYTGVHNQYMLLMGEAGLVPLLLFLLFIGLMLSSCARRRHSTAAIAALAWMVLIALFCLTFHTVLTNRLVEFLIGVSCALMMTPETRRHTERPG